MNHKIIHSPQGDVHYWITEHDDAASRPCIVFTHGVTADHSMFERQVDYFRSHFTVITWDVPLHGLSRPYKDFSYKHAAEDLKSILDTEHIDRVLLVGMSMGGYPSQMFGDLFPDRVDGFVALDTSPFGLDYYSASDLRWLKRVPGMAKMFPDQFLRKSMAKSVSQTSYSYNRMMSMLRPSSKQEIIEQLAVAYEQFPHENKDVHFTFPVLILLGDDDTTGKVSEYCRAWSNATGYPVHMIKNARHFSNGDNPEQVNAEIQKFADAVYAH